MLQVLQEAGAEPVRDPDVMLRDIGDDTIVDTGGDNTILADLGIGPIGWSAGSWLAAMSIVDKFLAT